MAWHFINQWWRTLCADVSIRCQTECIKVAGMRHLSVTLLLLDLSDGNKQVTGGFRLSSVLPAQA